MWEGGTAIGIHAALEMQCAERYSGSGHYLLLPSLTFLPPRLSATASRDALALGGRGKIDESACGRMDGTASESLVYVSLRSCAPPDG
jgi:hypothetical protein